MRTSRSKGDLVGVRMLPSPLHPTFRPGFHYALTPAVAALLEGPSQGEGQPIPIAPMTYSSEHENLLGTPYTLRSLYHVRVLTYLFVYRKLHNDAVLRVGPDSSACIGPYLELV